MNILHTLTDGVGYFALGWLLLWSLVLFVLMGRDKAARLGIQYHVD